MSPHDPHQEQVDQLNQTDECFAEKLAEGGRSEDELTAEELETSDECQDEQYDKFSRRAEMQQISSNKFTRQQQLLETAADCFDRKFKENDYSWTGTCDNGKSCFIDYMREKEYTSMKKRMLRCAQGSLQRSRRGKLVKSVIQKRRKNASRLAPAKRRVLLQKTRRRFMQ